MNKVIFLDRDGVINKDPAEKLYVMDWRDFEFLPGAILALKKLNQSGYRIIVISNQAGIGKGLFSLDNLNDINQKILAALEKEDIKIDKIYYCPHKKEDNCSCRKPKTGLFLRAVEELKLNNINWQKTYFIGDGKFDIEAGKSLNLMTILVLSGKTQMNDWRQWPVKPDFIAENLEEAVENIVSEKNQSARV